MHPSIGDIAALLIMPEEKAYGTDKIAINSFILKLVEANNWR
jgi:hypothetical protein